MFRNTIAVGPFDPAESCVTGGVCTVARHLAAGVVLLLGSRSGDADDVDREMPLESFVADCRKAMAAVSHDEMVLWAVTVVVEKEFQVEKFQLKGQD